MATKQLLIEQPFESDFGVVNVGDTVMAVATGYSHNVHVYKGKYLGYIESTQYGKPRKKVKLEVEEFNHVWYYKGTNIRWAYNYAEAIAPDFKEKFESRKISFTRKTTLNLNRIAPISNGNQVDLDAVQQLV